MSEEPGVSDQYRMASPWPVFVALGLTLSEVGIVIGVFAIAVGGLLLLAGSVAGILREAGYVGDVWWTLLGFGAVLLAIGVGLFASQVDLALDTVLAVVGSPGQHGRVVPRALAVAVAGLMLLAAAGAGRVFQPDPTDT
jgi:predicted tellurium resistance membrane protein TerC